MIHVVNRDYASIPDCATVVNIMRPSVYGNPYRMESEDDRDLVIRRYRRLVWKMWKDQNNELYYALQQLLRLENQNPHGQIYLVCCCKPLDCHGDKIKNFIDFMRMHNGKHNMFG